MDGRHFDDLARQLSSRRTLVGGLLAGLLLPLAATARKKDKRRKQKGKAKKRTTAQAEPCWRAGACIVSKGSNVSQCDLAGYTAPDPLDCTRCNLSRANLRGADLTGVNFTRANLSGACLVDADFTGATFTNATNLFYATFCRTIMPDGSVNNSGCGSGTECCPTCIGAGDTCGAGIGGSCCGAAPCSNGTCQTPCTPSCANKACGADDDCGGICQTGSCAPGLVCAAGRCIAAQGNCATGANTCAAGEQIACNSGQCFCEPSTEGQTACTDAFSMPGAGGNCGGCQTSADCVRLYPDTPGVICVNTAGTFCCSGGAGYCKPPCPTP